MCAVHADHSRAMLQEVPQLEVGAKGEDKAVVLQLASGVDFPRQLHGQKVFLKYKYYFVKSRSTRAPVAV